MITHSQVAMIGSMGQGASLSGNTGIKVPDFSDDGGNASVPGRKLKILKRRDEGSSHALNMLKTRRWVQNF